jgi:hypothetical protein
MANAGKAKGGKNKKGGKNGKDGEAKSGVASGSAAERSKLEEGEAAEAHLRDLSPEEKDAWGRINDRKVARSLREIWDKVPPSYRLMVTQYFREITEPEDLGNGKK